jgi:hypothetical protein
MNLPKGWSRRYHQRQILETARKIAACQHEEADSTGWCTQCGARHIAGLNWIVPLLVFDLNHNAAQMPAARRKKVAP